MTDSRDGALIYKVNLAHILETKSKDVLKQEKYWSCHMDTGAKIKYHLMAKTE